MHAVLIREGDAEPVCVGMLSLMSCVPAHGVVEIGSVLFTDAMKRSCAGTEAVWMLLERSFRDLGYRRVEWKCNNLNEPSKAAALRYGFTFEGVFRQHMVLRGKNRDSAWYSMLDSEYEGGIAEAFSTWLDEANFDADGKQYMSLSDLTRKWKTS